MEYLNVHYSLDAVLNILDRMLGPKVWTYFDAAIKKRDLNIFDVTNAFPHLFTALSKQQQNKNN